MIGMGRLWSGCGGGRVEDGGWRSWVNDLHVQVRVPFTICRVVVFINCNVMQGILESMKL